MAVSNRAEVYRLLEQALIDAETGDVTPASLLSQLMAELDPHLPRELQSGTFTARELPATLEADRDGPAIYYAPGDGRGFRVDRGQPQLSEWDLAVASALLQLSVNRIDPTVTTLRASFTPPKGPTA